jgi:hypothetical protein
MAGDETRYPSRELLDQEYPEHHDALHRGETDDSELGAMGEPLGGMGAPNFRTRRAINADNLADEVPRDHGTAPHCARPARGNRPVRNSGKRMEHVARGPETTTLSELAACSMATELAQINGYRRRCHPTQA